MPRENQGCGTGPAPPNPTRMPGLLHPSLSKTLGVVLSQVEEGLEQVWRKMFLGVEQDGL